MINQKGHQESGSSLIGPDSGYTAVAVAPTYYSNAGVVKKRASAFTSVKSTATDPKLNADHSTLAQNSEFYIQSDVNSAPSVTSNANEKIRTSSEISLTSKIAAPSPFVPNENASSHDPLVVGTHLN